MIGVSSQREPGGHVDPMETITRSDLSPSLLSLSFLSPVTSMAAVEIIKMRTRWGLCDPLIRGGERFIRATNSPRRTVTFRLHFPTRVKARDKTPTLSEKTADRPCSGASAKLVETRDGELDKSIRYALTPLTRGQLRFQSYLQSYSS